MAGKLGLVTPAEEFIPIAAQRGFQARQRREAWKIFPGLDALNIARAQPSLFRQLFLRQIPARSQRGDVFPESFPMRTAFWLARRHRRIVAQRPAAEHEALHRAMLSRMLMEARM